MTNVEKFNMKFKKNVKSTTFKPFNNETNTSLPYHGADTGSSQGHRKHGHIDWTKV